MKNQKDNKPWPRDIGSYDKVGSELSEIAGELKKINKRLDKLDKHINWIEKIFPEFIKKKFPNKNILLLAG